MLVLLAVGCGSNAIPAGTLAALQHADRYELLSLDPTRMRTVPPDNFHGWRVLGRASINDEATRKKLNDALRAGARENDRMVAACFNPRHGIHLVRGDSAHDLIICFECLQVDVFEHEQWIRGFLTSPSPQPVFDDVLRAARVPLANK